MLADGLPTPQRYWSMLAIAIGIFMAVLDSAVANVALPTIANVLHATPAEAVWVVNAYQLVIVVALLPLASLGERIGYRRVSLAGLAMFVAGSLLCALSHQLWQLIAARMIQGIGGAGLMSVNGALVRYTYPKDQMGRGVGLNAFVVSLSSAIGPTIASAVLAVASWEWLFAINVPIGLVSLAIATRALPRSDLSEKRFDWLSASLNAVFFGLFFVGSEAVTHEGAIQRVGAGLLVLAVAAGALLLKREMRRDEPLIPLDLLRIPVFALSVLASVCAFAAYMLAFIELPFFFENVLGRDRVETGLLMTPWPVAVGLAAPLAGRLSDKVPSAALGSLGLAALAVGLALLAFGSQTPTTAAIVWQTALCGAGFGLFQAPNNRILLLSAPRRRAGAAGGMLATARLVGLTLGATLAAAVFRIAPGSAKTTDLAIGVGFAIVAAVASLLRSGREPARTPAAASPAALATPEGILPAGTRSSEESLPVFTSESAQ